MTSISTARAGERSWLVPDDGPGGERLDRLLAAAWPDLSRSRLQSLIRGGCVRLDGCGVADPAARPRAGALVTLAEPPPDDPIPGPEPLPLTVVYEDEQVIVIDKPAGLVVHPGAGHDSGTLVNALIAHCGSSLSGIGGVRRPGIVHRLDKDTSGLLVVAKTDAAHRALSAQFADHGRTGPLERAYQAFVWGVPEPPAGTIVASLARSSSDREKMAVVAEGRGRSAITHYRLEEPFRGAAGDAVASLVGCRLETGRTHQIRVHLAHRRHPLLGDKLYGAGFRTKAERLGPAARESVATLGGRQALHAGQLAFGHPTDGRIMRFTSPLPPELEALRTALRGPTDRERTEPPAG